MGMVELSACRNYEIGWEKCRGKGRKTWRECVKDDIKHGSGNVGCWPVDGVGWRDLG